MNKLNALSVTFLIFALTGLSACKTVSLPSISRDAPAPREEAPLRAQKLAIPPSGWIVSEAGDTLYDVATRYQVTPQSIISDNQLQPPYEISAGMRLKLSPVRYHIVKIEDNLYNLSQRYAVSQYQLASLNELSEPYELTVGQQLILPDSLDFSVLDIEGLAAENVPATTVKPAAQQASKTPSQPVKYFVAPSLGQSGFTWPVKGEIIAEFGPMARGVHNDGVNIKAESGTIVTTSAAGTVAFVGTGLKSFGNLVLVKHEGGYITAYAHLSDIQVNEGDVLGSGSQIGLVGMSGRVDSPQLHFEIRQSRTPMNPRDFLS